MATSKTDRATRAQQLLVGTNKHYPNASETLSVGGATYTVTALTQIFQAVVNNREAVSAARATTQAKVAAELAQAPSQNAVMAAFEKVVRGTFGTSADVLADFGLAPPKVPAPMTAEAKAVAAAKRVATRAARQTLGKNQKKKVKGAVTATLVVTPSSGAAPSVTATPAVIPPAAPPATTGPAQAGASTPRVQ